MPDIQMQEYVQKIQNLIQEHRQDEAIAHCQHILDLYPRHVQTYRLLGEACLADGKYQEARDFFQRVLSADPQNLVAWVGLGSVYDELGMLPEAIWPMERAFEQAPGNQEVQRKLLRLYARRDGAQTTRLRLTRGALGQLYARNGLDEQAIGEFRAALGQDLNQPGIHVALLEVFWRQGRALEAAEACLEILEALPNCLKANLILGAIRLQPTDGRSGQEDAGQARLEIARALDPENLVAQEVLGGESPLPLEQVLVPVLKADGVGPLPVEDMVEELPPAEQIPDWVRELELLQEETTHLSAVRERPQVLVEVGIPNEAGQKVGLAEMPAGEVVTGASPARAEPDSPLPGMSAEE